MKIPKEPVLFNLIALFFKLILKTIAFLLSNGLSLSSLLPARQTGTATAGLGKNDQRPQ
ncbi:MAG: hypothetical protein ACKV1O_22110 [Saprospiraceae bacterium]